MNTKDDYKEQFGRAHEIARERGGFYRELYAEEIGVSSNAVKKWETGESFPRPHLWPAIKAMIGLDPQQYRPYSQDRSYKQSRHIENSKGYKEIHGGVTTTDKDLLVERRKTKMSQSQEKLIALINILDNPEECTQALIQTVIGKITASK